MASKILYNEAHPRCLEFDFYPSPHSLCSSHSGRLTVSWKLCTIPPLSHGIRWSFHLQCSSPEIIGGHCLPSFKYASECHCLYRAPPGSLSLAFRELARPSLSLPPTRLPSAAEGSLLGEGILFLPSSDSSKSVLEQCLAHHMHSEIAVKFILIGSPGKLTYLASLYESQTIIYTANSKQTCAAYGVVLRD